jgi:D-glycero-D-manno-heptose 1,7-bisphosphate phosphatase
MSTMKMDNTWTLFLDRDGVINHEKVEDYIHHWNEFVFYPGATQAIATLSEWFGKIIVVTNQKGIGKGVTLLEDVETIHTNMIREIVEAGGRIDAIYFCPDTDSSSPKRKPNPGMAFQAKMDFPEIDLAKSLMVGNNLSDLTFGRNAGMKTAFLRTTKPELTLPDGMADFEASDLFRLPAIISHCFTAGC